MDLFELHVLIQKHLEATVLLFGNIFWLNHALKVSVLIKFGTHLFYLAFRLPYLSQVRVELRLLLNNYFILRGFASLIYEFFPFLDLNGPVNKVFELIYNYKNHISKFDILLMQSHQILLFFFSWPFTRQIYYTRIFIQAFKFWNFGDKTILTHGACILFPIHMDASHGHLKHTGVIFRCKLILQRIQNLCIMVVLQAILL